MNAYSKVGIQLHQAMVSTIARAQDDRGEVSSYLILVGLLAVAALALGTKFSTFFTNLMNDTCSSANTTC